MLKLNNKIITLGGSVVNCVPVYDVDFTNMATTSKCTRTDAAANFADPQPAVAGARPIHLECCQASAFK